MVRLQPDPFLNELTSMFERTMETGSVWVTLKHCNIVYILIFISLLNDFIKTIKFSLHYELAASDKSKAQRNKLKTSGEKIEYKCLIRATDGKKNISTMVGPKDHQRFQASYAILLKARMTALKKRERKDRKKAANPEKKQEGFKKQSAATKASS